jgi:hypothetical protein
VSPPRVIDEQESLRDLVARVIDNTKAYLRAEVALQKQRAATWAGRAGPAVGLLIGALLIVQASLTVLVAALGWLVASWLGPAGGFAAAALLGLALAGLLAWIAVRQITRAPK